MQQTLGITNIMNEEFRISKYVENRLQKDPRIVILGRKHSLVLSANTDTENSNSNSNNSRSYDHNSDMDASNEGNANYLPIFSFLIRANNENAPTPYSTQGSTTTKGGGNKGRFLHYNFVCALLNDLFGIQSRGGCMCAGPYSQVLLGLNESDSFKIENALLEKHEILRPGYTRISLPFWMLHDEIEYVINAILIIAEHGWKFLSLYRYNHKTGEWAHTTRLTR